MSNKINEALIEEIADLTVKAQDISHGIYEDLESLSASYRKGELTEAETREQLAELRDSLSEAEAE